ncbi:hypothetical protein BJX61DRAFT_96470 [Aspergillus egyptiacus]|nr:hypothetical protein BJX61DRAFT_96470 [Aspergillus egyptiacus]
MDPGCRLVPTPIIKNGPSYVVIEVADTTPVIANTSQKQHSRSHATEVPREKPSILRLPPELLMHIISLTATDIDSPSAYLSIRSLINLASSCRYLYPLVLPTLYSALSIPGRPVQGWGLLEQRVEQIHRAVQQNPAVFRNACKEVWLEIPEGSNAKCLDRVHGILAQLHNLRRMSITSSEFTLHARERIRENAWSLARTALSYAKRLESLTLECRPCLQDIFENIEAACPPSRKELVIYNVKRTPGITMGDKPKKPDTATITSLKISGFDESAEAHGRLVSWPKSLVHFGFDSRESAVKDALKLDLTIFQTWLSRHKETLKSVDIRGPSPKGELKFFNAHIFPNLEVLTLSRSLLGLGEDSWMLSPSAIYTVDCLIGPKLHTFTLYIPLPHKSSLGENQD